MAFAIRAVIPGMTLEQYRGIFAQVKDRFPGAKGFQLHFGGPTEGGCYVVEVWDTQEDQEAWLRDVIAPLMPPGAPAPEITPMQVDNVLTR